MAEEKKQFSKKKLDQEAFARQLASVLLSRSQFRGTDGLTFNGNRDMYEALGYKRILTIYDFQARYTRDGMAARIVEAMPKATWRGGGELVEDDGKPEMTEFEAAWDSLNTRLNVWSTFEKADILAGIGTYAVILIGAPGNMLSPLPKLKGPDDIFYLRAFAQCDADIVELETRTDNPRFGRPTLYELKGLDPTTDLKRRVHFSRILHVADNTLDGLNFGQPRLQRVWNRLDDLEKITGGGAEAYWLRAHQGYQFDLDKEMEVDSGEEQALDEEVENFIHGLSRTVRTRGVQLKALGSDVANFDRNADAVLVQLSAASGIPHRILTGSERGELASTQDRNNWNERVSDRRDEFAAPQVIRPFADRLIALGGLPTPKSYDVRWPQMKDLTDKEKGDLTKTLSEANDKMGGTLLVGNELRDRIWQWPPIEGGDQPVKPKPAPAPGQPGQQNQGGQPASGNALPTAAEGNTIRPRLVADR